MNAKRPYIFLLLCLIFSLKVFGQDSTEYSWKSKTPSVSIDELKAFRAIYEDGSNTEDWKDTQRLAFLKKGLNAAEQLKSNDDIIYFSVRLGNRYYFIDSFSQAIRYIKYPIELSHDTISVARSYNRLGYIYFDLGDYNKALEHLFESVRYGKMLNRGWETYPFGNISNVYKHLEDYDNAIKYTKGSMVIDAKADSPEREYGYVYNYTALLILSEKNNQLDSCFEYIDLINEKMTVIDTMENPTYQAAINYAYVTIADFYIKNDMLEKAKVYLDLAEKNEDFNQEAFLLSSGKYWLKKKDFNRAKLFINKYDSAGTQNLQSIENLLNLKIEYHKAIGDLATVIQLQEELLQTQKEKFGNDRLRYGTFASAEFQNLEQQQQITALENQRKLDKLHARNRIVGVFVAFLIMVGIAVFLWYQNKQRKENAKKINGLLEQLKVTNTELSNSNKDLEQFAYVASHDLQEPLRTVGNFVNLLDEENEGKFDEESKLYMEYVTDGVTRMSTLIDALLSYSKLGSSKIKISPINPRTIIQHKIQDLSIKIKESNANVIVRDLPESIHAEPNQFGIIVYNLINNGIKFNRSAVPTITIDSVTKADHHLFTIKDNGIGIDSKNHNKIFEVFKRLHRKEDYKGTGIGLASVKRIVTKHGGEVWLESTLGEGTTFYFTIPKR